MTTTNSLNITQSGIVGYNNVNGTFMGSPVTQFCIQIGATNNQLSSLPIGASGQALLSNGPGVAPSFQSISQGMTGSNVTTTTQQVSANMIYITNTATQVTYTLPASPAIGDAFEVICGVTCAAITPFKIAQNAGQQILIGDQSTTVGVTGNIIATVKNAAIRLVCVVGGTSAVYQVVSSYLGMTPN